MKSYPILFLGLFLAGFLCIPVYAANISITGDLLGKAGETVLAEVVLDSVPNGLSGYNITFSVRQPGTGEITAVTFPAWAGISKTSPLPSSTVWIRAADTTFSIQEGDKVVLATISIRLLRDGPVELETGEMRIDDYYGKIIQDGYTPVPSGTQSGTIFEPSSPVSSPVPTGTAGGGAGEVDQYANVSGSSSDKNQEGQVPFTGQPTQDGMAEGQVESPVTTPATRTPFDAAALSLAALAAAAIWTWKKHQ